MIDATIRCVEATVESFFVDFIYRTLCIGYCLLAVDHRLPEKSVLSGILIIIRKVLISIRRIFLTSAAF